MKLEVLNDSLEQTDISKMSVNVDNLTYSLMIDGIYTDKLSSVIRELSTNARDSQLTVNNTQPFLITLRSEEDFSSVIMSIKDFGTGLTTEEAQTFLCNLNASNKRESSDAVGCFGIGSKSPFSVVDSYDFNCVKDNVNTHLNLFRINSETPRFLTSVTEVEAPNSVECIVKLEEYTLEQVLESIYIELALFDIQPRILIKTNSKEVLLEPEDFFCSKYEYDSYFHLFYRKPSESLTEMFGEKSEKLVTNFYIKLKNRKRVACGVIGYQCMSVGSSQNNYYGNNAAGAIADFYMFKFSLDSNIKFDVSRENIVNDRSTTTLLREKFQDCYSTINLEEAAKLITLYTILSPSAYSHYSTYSVSDLEELAPLFLEELQEGLYIQERIPANGNTAASSVMHLDLNFAFGKMKESLNYYKDNLEELSNLLFLVNSRGLYVGVTVDRSLQFILANRRNDLDLSVLSFLEKVICSTTTIWENAFKNNVVVLNNPGFLSLAIKNQFLGRYQSYRLRAEKVLVKDFTFIPKYIDNLGVLDFDIICNHKKLQSIKNMELATNLYALKPENKNKIVLILSGTKGSILDHNLRFNLEMFSRFPTVNIYDLEEYSEINSEFVEDVRYKAPLRPDRTTRVRETVTLSDGTEQAVVQTHNSIGVRLRHKISISYVKFPDGVLTQSTEDTTSLKFYDSNKTDSYHGRQTLILVSKDIIKTQEEKELITAGICSSYFNFIFEIDNLESYDSIKEVALIVLKQNLYSPSNPPIIEFNTKFADEELLKSYSKLLIWKYQKSVAFENYRDLILSIPEDPESILLAPESEEEGLASYGYYSNTNALGTDTLLSRKVKSFASLFGISAASPYTHLMISNLAETSYSEESLPFKGISILMNDSLLDDYVKTSNNSRYSKDLFKSSGINSINNSDFFCINRSPSIAYLDILLGTSDRLLYNRMFNQEYLNSIQENFNTPLISFNEEHLKKLLKEY